MNHKFTQRAQEALRLAETRARNAKSAFIGTEHLLWGIASEGKGIGARALASFGVNPEAVNHIIDDNANLGETFGGFSPRVKSALQLAVEEARRMNVGFLGTEHLLLGLVAEGEGLAAQFLKNPMGVGLVKMRNIVAKMTDNTNTAAENPQQPAAGQTQQAAVQSKTPTLDEYGRDLTAAAREDKLDPVIGRGKEIQRVIQVLSRRTKNNPVLIGEPGVGKTAIAEGLAQIIVKGEIPDILEGKRVMMLDMASMVAGTKFRGEFEERMQKVVNEIRGTEDVILFIDEVHTVVGAGAAEGAIDAANIMKPALARGDLQCIGATTLDEYRKHIEKDAALERRFQPVLVGEPNEEDAIKILFGLRDRYEAHHRVKITDEALKAAVTLSERYLSDRFLPDKAIDLIDEASSMVRLAAHTAPPDVKELEAELERIRREKEAAIAGQEYEKAAEMRDREKAQQKKIESERENWKSAQKAKKSVVDVDEITGVLAGWTGIPVARLNQEEMEGLLKLEERLHERVVGQDEAVVSVAKAVRRARAGLKDSRRPVGSFIFLGPTGVGKTELAKSLAKSLFDSEDAMIRLDMSEYMEKHNASRLVGAPPGYIGYDEGGQLTEAVRRRPYSVVLLDEIEKAHPDVFNMLLQVLEDGRLTDSTGRTVDFRNAIIIMTSNLGSSFAKRNVVGFGVNQEQDTSHEAMKSRVDEALKKMFKPEFLNRIDETVIFHALTGEQIKQIAQLMVGELQKRLAARDIEMTVEDSVYEKLAEVGFDEVFGARPLRRAVLRLLEDPMAEAILEGRFGEGDTVVAVFGDDGKIAFSKKKKTQARKKDKAGVATPD